MRVNSEARASCCCTLRLGETFHLRVPTWNRPGQTRPEQKTAATTQCARPCRPCGFPRGNQRWGGLHPANKLSLAPPTWRRRTHPWTWTGPPTAPRDGNARQRLRLRSLSPPDLAVGESDAEWRSAKTQVPEPSPPTHSPTQSLNPPPPTGRQHPFPRFAHVPEPTSFFSTS